MSPVYLSLHHFRIGYLPLSVWHTTVWHTILVPVTCRCLSGEQGKSAARGRGRPLGRRPVDRLVFLFVSGCPLSTSLYTILVLVTCRCLSGEQEKSAARGRGRPLRRWPVNRLVFCLFLDVSCLPVFATF